MNNKKMVPITQLLDFIVDNRGKSCPTSKTGFPLIATNCIKHSSIYPTFENIRYVTEDTLKNWFRAELKPNDILFVNKGTPGRVCLVPDPVNFCAAQDMIGLRVNKDKVYYKYLFAVLRSEYIQKKIMNYHVGVAIPHFRKSDMDNLLIPIVDMEKQIAIGDLYVLLSEKISNNNKINLELESLAKTLYDYWFLQFEFPNEEGKPYKSSGGKMVYNEQLKKEIPECWEVLKVKDLLNVITGKQDSNFATINGAYKFFTCSSEVLNCDEYAFEGKAVLLAGNGDFNVKHYQGKFNAYQRTYVLIPKEEKYFGSIYLATEKLVKKFKAGSNGSIVKFITKGDVENIEILKPLNDNLLEQFNLILKFIEKNKEENEELTKLRDFLLPLLMNGQVTIQDAEQQVSNTISSVWNAEKLLRFAQWKQMQGYAARGAVDEDTLMKIFDAMDKDAKK